MAVLDTMLRQDGLKLAEARVRALTREVGSLKEDLRRETKRREKATIASKETEEIKLDCEKRVKQLEYSKRKLEQESFSAQQHACHDTARSRAVTNSLRDELAAREETAAKQTAACHHQLQHMSMSLKRLQSLLLEAEPGREPALFSKAIPAVQSRFADVMDSLSQLSRTICAEGSCLALPAAGSPCHSPHHHSRAELERLRTVVALLQAQQQANADATRAQQSAAADMSNLIPDYRATLARMEAQVGDLRQRLEDAYQDRSSLQEQVTLLRKACKSPATKPSRKSSPPTLAAQASEDEEDAKRLIRDIRGLKKRCQLLEAETDALCVTNTELQTAVSDRDEQLVRQRQVIENLEATIHDQSSDIRTALQLVTTSQGIRSCNQLAKQQEDIDAAMQLCNQTEHEDWQQHCRSHCDVSQCSPHRQTRLDAFWCKGLPQKARVSTSQPQSPYLSDMHTLCRDMQQLDSELAELDIGLASASHRTCC